MKARFFILALSLFVLALPLQAQNPPRPSPPQAPVVLKGKPVFHPFSNNTGISQKSTRQVVMDRQGLLWVAALDNENGLAYLSGDRWVQVEIPGREPTDLIRTLLSTSDGSLWVGQDRRIVRYRNGEWTTFIPTIEKGKFTRIDHLVEEPRNDGSLCLWMSCAGGLYRLELSKNEADPPRWEKFGPNINPTVSVAFGTLLSGTDREQKPYLWIGTKQHGLVRYDGHRWEIFNQQNVGLPSDSIRSLFETTQPDGTPILWIGTDNAGLVRYDGKTWTTFDTRNSPLPNNSIQALATTFNARGDEFLWIGTYGGGLVRLPMMTPELPEKWEVFDVRNSSLPNNVVWALFPDPGPRGHGIWIGTESGVVRVVEGQWEMLDTLTAPVPNSGVYCFLETATPDGRSVIWMGSRNGGIVRWTAPADPRSAGEWKTFDLENSGFFHDRVTALVNIHESDGRRVVWAGTYTEGLAIFENERWRVEPLPQFGPFGKFIRSIHETRNPDGSHTQWVGTRDGGLLRREKGQWTRIQPGDDGFPDKTIWFLIEADLPGGGGRTIWVATGNGITYLKGNRWVSFDTAGTPPSVNHPTSLLETVGTDGRHFLWTASMSGGVSRLDLSDPAARWIQPEKRPDQPIPPGVIYALATDRQQAVYIFAQGGAVRLTPKGKAQKGFGDYEYRHFTTEDGMPSNESNLNATMLDSRGRIWVGMVAGVGIFNPADYLPPKENDVLFLERARFGPENEALKDGAVLSHDRNKVSFTFSLLNYYRASDTRYRCQLVGVDPAPSGWTSAPSREYTNLGAGNYIFKVWAKNADGKEIGPILTSFSVKPAPWRSLPAYFIYALAFVFGLYLFLKVRTMALQKLNQNLEQRVAERTTELERTIVLLKEAQAQIENRNERLRHSQKMETIGQLAGGIAHNFNNILAIILGYSELLLSETPAENPSSKPLKAIDKAAKRGRDLVKKLMAFSRKTETRPETLDLNKIVRSTISIVEQVIGGRCVIQADLEPFPAVIRIDRQELEQALLNLFINARDAMTAGGVIRVKTSPPIREGTPVTPTGRFVRFTSAGKSPVLEDGTPGPFPEECTYVRLTISDSGVGMSDDVMAHLFEPFFTTKEEGKGTGLGLATVFGAVMGAGGFIEVESSLGEGTHFRLYFPLIEEDVNLLMLSGSGKFDILRQYRGNTETVLVIEDEPEVRDYISQILLAMNYQVIAAPDGSTGLNHLRTQGEGISVVLMDLVLPGLSGIDLAKTIRGERPDLPVLSMSGNNEKPTHSAGVQTHLEKPFTAESLLQAVKFGLSGINP